MDDLKYSEILMLNSKMAKYKTSSPPYEIKVLSNITCNQLKEILEYNLRSSGLNPFVEFGNYDNIIQDSYNCQGSQMVVVIYDLINVIDKSAEFIEDFSNNEIKALIISIKSEISLIFNNLVNIPVVVINTFSSYAFFTDPIRLSKSQTIVDELNIYLKENKPSNCNLIDLNLILGKVGISTAIDHRMFNLSKALYTLAFWKEFVYTISSVAYKYTGKLKKAIIFDCDNTLWKGIIGEDGFWGIEMSNNSKTGHIFNKVQQIAVWLSNHGVIIGICSKNNPEDVDKVFMDHPDMKLKKEHIVISRVNWQDKATNISDIAKELNIGLDSIVFVDDSSFEINLINDFLPDVLTLQIPQAVNDYPLKLLTIIQRFFNFSDTQEDLGKVSMYKEQSLRNEEKGKFASLDEYLESLNIEISIDENDSKEVLRMSQLTQKTNQFNFTTRRYTEKQIEQFIENKHYTIYSFSVSDKFGDNGLTAICIVQEINNDEVLIDTFLMSCRIMGRNIENVIMNYIIGALGKKGYTKVHSEFIPTKRNFPVNGFYEQMGFSLVSENDNSKKYKINISQYVQSSINYIKIK